MLALHVGGLALAPTLFFARSIELGSALHEKVARPRPPAFELQERVEACAFDLVIKTQVRTYPSNIRMLGFKSWLCLWVPLRANTEPGGQQ